MTPDQLTLPTARRSDPHTSHQAARSVGDGVWPVVLQAFRTWGPMTGDELCDKLPDLYAPTIKSCRSRLRNQGWIEPTAYTRPSARGREQIVWALIPEYRATDVVTATKGIL